MEFARELTSLQTWFYNTRFYARSVSILFSRQGWHTVSNEVSAGVQCGLTRLITYWHPMKFTLLSPVYFSSGNVSTIQYVYILEIPLTVESHLITKLQLSQNSTFARERIAERSPNGTYKRLNSQTDYLQSWMKSHSPSSHFNLLPVRTLISGLRFEGPS